MYLKRQNIGKFWPLPRKGTKYLAVPTHNKKNSIPLIVGMREILGLVKNKKELKKILNEKKVKINEKIIRETNYPLEFFDILQLVDPNKYYKAGLGKNRKFYFEEIYKDVNKKIIKIIGKKILKKKITQLNLMDGRNILSKEKVKIGDSVLFNFEKNKIEKIIKMEKGKKSFVFDGKYAGLEGIIEDIIESGGKKLVVIKTDRKTNVLIKNVIAIE